MSTGISHPTLGKLNQIKCICQEENAREFSFNRYDTIEELVNQIIDDHTLAHEPAPHPQPPVGHSTPA